jgi:hypothetical protein
MGQLVVDGNWPILEMLLLPLARNGVLMAEDKVHNVRRTTLVGTKHDDVRIVVLELLGVEGLAVAVGRNELQVGAAALLSFLQTYLVPAGKDQSQ